MRFVCSFAAAAERTWCQVYILNTNFMLLFHAAPNSQGGNYYDDIYYYGDTTVGLGIICFHALKTFQLK